MITPRLEKIKTRLFEKEYHDPGIWYFKDVNIPVSYTHLLVSRRAFSGTTRPVKMSSADQSPTKVSTLAMSMTVPPPTAMMRPVSAGILARMASIIWSFGSPAPYSSWNSTGQGRPHACMNGS